MTVLVRTNSNGESIGIHRRPEMLDDPASQGYLFDRMVEPSRDSGREYRLTISGDLPLWQSRTSAELDDDGNVITPAGDWLDESGAFREQKRTMKRPAAREQFQASLERGYTFDNGTWAPVGSRRQRVLEIVAGINAGKGLPQGKTSITLRDASGTAHSFDEQQIVDLAAEANDLVDKAETRYEEIIGQIDAATSQSDLDAIDVTAGWPN